MSSVPLLIFFCLIFGEIAKKLRLPSILGYMAGGVFMGHDILNLISEKTNETLEIINYIALGLMSLTIGTHINFHKLKNSGRRIFITSFFEISLTFGFVFALCFYFFELSPYVSFLLAAIALETAPATTITLVQETKAKGTLINTLLPMVAINNVACIILFGFTLNFIGHSHSGKEDVLIRLYNSLLISGRELVLGGFIAWIMGYSLKRLAAKFSSHPGEMLTGVFFLIMATAGICLALKINPMMPCLFMGIYISNSGTHRASIINTFEDIQHLIIVLFFGLAGTHVNFSSFQPAALYIMGFIIARFGGKYIGSYLGSFITRSPKRIRNFLGLTTLPQAGLSIGLIVLAYQIEELKPYMGLLTAIVLVSVNINEFIGPILVKFSLNKSGEAGQDREKIISFLGEEFIHPNLKATTKEEAIQELVRFLIRSHNLSMDNLEHFESIVLEREKEQSTALGDGIAIPHGIVSEGADDILGAIGLIPNGLECDAPDGKPVYLMIMLLTPKKKGTKHLKVLAEIVKLVENKHIREQLFKAKTAAGLFEIIHHHEHETFNYFVNEEDQ